MSVRSKTTKELAARIDPRYVRQSWWTRWRVRILVALPALIGIGAWAFLFIRMPEKARAMLNPGPVSIAHGMWETKCDTCHDKDGTGTFRVQVTDEACLKCHSAPLHHPNQILRTEKNRKNPLALAMDDHGTKRAAHCVSCHVEHKGHERLTAISDINCTQCHENIVKAVPPTTKPGTANAWHFDNKGSHPYFGSKLAPGGITSRPPAPLTPALHDPTNLRFGHNVKVHADIEAVAGTNVNCTRCHVPMEQLPETHAPSPSGDTLYRQALVFRQVSFSHDCRRDCHSLDTELPIPHESMESIARQLRHLDDLYSRWLPTLTPEERETKTGTKTPGKDELNTLVTGAADVTKTAVQWFEGKPWTTAPADAPESASDKATRVVLANLAKAIEPEISKPTVEAPDPRLLLYLAFGTAKKYRCAECHDFRDPGGPGLSQGAASSKPASAPPAAAAETPAAPATEGAREYWLTTVPTLVTDKPRRWFTHSAFDHRPHQNLTCLSCHLAAKTSIATSDVLSPNMIWQQETGTASCVDCHHPTDSSGRGARANCVTCHNFHDHSQTTAPPNLLVWDGKKKDFIATKPPTTQPVAH